MRVLVVNNAVPFVRGGAEELADHLVRRLNAVKGVEAELMRVPFAWQPAGRLLDEVMLNRMLVVPNTDRIIALKFPAYLIPHHDKRLWLLHQFRQAYDLYESGHSHLIGEEGDRIRGIIKQADDACFAKCNGIYTNSPVTQARLKRFNGMDSEVLYPPLNNPESFTGGPYEKYVFAGGRVSGGKRQNLLIEAMGHVRSDVRLIIAGPPDDAATATALAAQIAKLGLGDRIELRLGFRPLDEIAQLANNALACAYIPVDEDSLGYVTMEAFAAAKPVITTTDSGGLLEIVQDRNTGRVVAPDAKALADAIDELAADPPKAQAMGHAGRAMLQAKGLTWDNVINTLLG